MIYICCTCFCIFKMSIIFVSQCKFTEWMIFAWMNDTRDPGKSLFQLFLSYVYIVTLGVIKLPHITIMLTKLTKHLISIVCFWSGPNPDTPPAPRCQWRYDACVSPCFKTCSDPFAEACITIPQWDLPLYSEHYSQNYQLEKSVLRRH